MGEHKKHTCSINTHTHHLPGCYSAIPQQWLRWNYPISRLWGWKAQAPQKGESQALGVLLIHNVKPVLKISVCVSIWAHTERWTVVLVTRVCIKGTKRTEVMETGSEMCKWSKYTKIVKSTFQVNWNCILFINSEIGLPLKRINKQVEKRLLSKVIYYYSFFWVWTLSLYHFFLWFSINRHSITPFTIVFWMRI